MTTVLQAIEIGQELLDMKGRLDHGRFQHWVAENYSFSTTTAARYMKIAWNRSLFEAMPLNELSRLDLLSAAVILKRKGQYRVPLQRQINERPRIVRVLALWEADTPQR